MTAITSNTIIDTAVTDDWLAERLLTDAKPLRIAGLESGSTTF
jgi:hypothetical protein